MLLELERDKAITDKVILIQKVVRGFKDRYSEAVPAESLMAGFLHGKSHCVSQGQCGRTEEDGVCHPLWGDGISCV